MVSLGLTVDNPREGSCVKKKRAKEELLVEEFGGFSLTKEEEEDLITVDDAYGGRLEDCKFSLVGKVFTEKSVNKKALRSTIRLMWNVGKEVKIVDVGNSMIHVKFQSDFQMKKVIERGPWMFDNHLLLLKRWERGIHVKNVEFLSITFWIQVWGLPFDCKGRQVEEDIGRRIEEVIDVDLREEFEEQGQFWRIRVDIPVSKPLGRGGRILLHNGEKVWVEFCYERLPIFCYYCGQLGHDKKSCIKKYNNEKVGLHLSN
ncbi:hypothetical protein L1049_003117 [Liquidambar formosana]|uniref:CCHC-type domain-containing protein n=1 Tax=Liquidambar formosana TaxID=63359 RepID=A0AAP0NH13_LIQFO